MSVNYPRDGFRVTGALAEFGRSDAVWRGGRVGGYKLILRIFDSVGWEVFSGKMPVKACDSVWSAKPLGAR